LGARDFLQENEQRFLREAKIVVKIVYDICAEYNYLR